MMGKGTGLPVPFFVFDPNHPNKKRVTLEIKAFF
jgi:hypothetical protein